MKPTRCTLLLSIFISTSVHVSGNYVPISRRTYCIYATLVFFTLYGRLVPTSGPDMRRTGGYTWTDYITNAHVAKELKITPILDKLLEYKRSWVQHVRRMPRNRLPRVMKHCCPTGRRNHGRLLKRLLGT